MFKSYLKIFLLVAMPLSCFADSKYPQTRDEKRAESMGSILGEENLSFGFTKSKEQVLEKSTTIPSTKDEYKALWQAAVECLEARPIISSNYDGGTIITDWYQDDFSTTKIIVIIKGDTVSPKSLNVQVWVRFSPDGLTTKRDSKLEQKMIALIIKKAMANLLI